MKTGNNTMSCHPSPTMTTTLTLPLMTGLGASRHCWGLATKRWPPSICLRSACTVSWWTDTWRQRIQ